MGLTGIHLSLFVDLIFCGSNGDAVTPHLNLLQPEDGQLDALWPGQVAYDAEEGRVGAGLLLVHIPGDAQDLQTLLFHQAGSRVVKCLPAGSRRHEKAPPGSCAG